MANVVQIYVTSLYFNFLRSRQFIVLTDWMTDSWDLSTEEAGASVYFLP